MSDSLKRQLERTRFERALEVAESMADHRVLLTTMELARLNDILTGKTSSATAASAPTPGAEGEGEPWRKTPVTLRLPSGRTETMALIADPKLNVRDQLHRATELAEGGSVIDAAVHLYAGLVLAHPFEDANRRSAVLAAHYFLRRYGIPVSGLALHELGLGDLREAGQVESLRETIEQMAKFALRNKPRD